MREHNFVVREQPEAEQNRLDKVIVALEPSFSRGQIRQLIERGAVYLNGKRCKVAGRPVRGGDAIRVMIPTKKETAAPSISQENVIFENLDWIVVNKPAFLPTHATVDDTRENLVHALQEFLGKREGTTAKQVYLGVHHRLDRDTSGVIFFTRRKEANAAVAKAFQAREVQKTYLAVTVGAPKQKEFTIKNYLGRDPRNKRRMRSLPSGGDYAETICRLLASVEYQGQRLSLIEAKPVTGRMHQIRVHLSEHGLPIAGDETYGKLLPGVPRLMLHAFRLEMLGQKWSAPAGTEFSSLGFAL